MHLAISSTLLIVSGIVNAVHHHENQDFSDLNRVKYKRSVLNGIPYPYGYSMPIEPFERELDSHLDAYQPSGFWPYQQSSMQHWEFPATFPEPTAVNPENRVHEYLVSAPRPDVVYRTLMQRAAAAAASTAVDVPDRGGNVNIQLTANLVYGYQPSGHRPSDVDEPVVAFPWIIPASRFARPGPFVDDSLQEPVMVPKNSADSEPSVIIMALSSSGSSEVKDTIASDVDKFDDLMSNLKAISSSVRDKSSFATATTTTEDPFTVIYNKLMQQIKSEDSSKATTLPTSESSNGATTTTTEVNPAENELDAYSYTELTTETADNEQEQSAACVDGDENNECSEMTDKVVTELVTELPDENKSDDDTENNSLNRVPNFMVEVVDDIGNIVEWSVTTEDPTTTTQAEEEEEEEEEEDENDSDDDSDNEWVSNLTENVPKPTTTTRPVEEDESWDSVITDKIEPKIIEYNY